MSGFAHLGGHPPLVEPVGDLGQDPSLRTDSPDMEGLLRLGLDRSEVKWTGEVLVDTLTLDSG